MSMNSRYENATNNVFGLMTIRDLKTLKICNKESKNYSEGLDKVINKEFERRGISIVGNEVFELIHLNDTEDQEVIIENKQKEEGFIDTLKKSFKLNN